MRGRPLRMQCARLDVRRGALEGKPDPFAPGLMPAGRAAHFLGAVKGADASAALQLDASPPESQGEEEVATPAGIGQQLRRGRQEENLGTVAHAGPAQPSVDEQRPLQGRHVTLGFVTRLGDDDAKWGVMVLVVDVHRC